MSYIDAPVRQFANNSALAKGTRVILSSSNLVAAGAADFELGVVESKANSNDKTATVRLRTAAGTRTMIANAAITALAKVYAAASGKIAPTGTLCRGIALEAATADGDLIEVLPMEEDENILFEQVAASSAVTNTITETAFDQSFTIPANTLKAGDVLRIRAQAIATATNSTDTLTLKLKIGSTVIVATGAVDVANNDIGYIDAVVVIRTSGASGTLVGTGDWNLGVPGTATTRAFNLASTAVDTTATQAVTVTATWSVANAGNSVRLDILDIKKN